ncbi:MAG: hypothetical protein ABW131_08515, partial [Candidatus Sedimenticola sp. 6PFRAG5]
MSESSFYRVAVPAPLYGVFDYLPPDGDRSRPPEPGVRVLVPFGRGERCGVLLALVDQTDVPR